MVAELGTGVGALALLVGFPLLLLGAIGVLGWLEAWMLQPYERAVAITELLEGEEEVDEVEAAVVRLTAQVADPAAERARARSAAERHEDGRAVLVRSQASQPAR